MRRLCLVRLVQTALVLAVCAVLLAVGNTAVRAVEVQAEAMEQIDVPLEVQSDLSIEDKAESELSSQTEIPSVSYCVHVQGIGDQPWRKDGEEAGTHGESRRLESLQLKLDGAKGDIECKAHVQTIGWQDWTTSEAGTRGMSRRLEAICVRLTGEVAQTHDVWYRVHAQKVGWTAWTSNGEAAGTEGMSWRLEALQVIILPKGSETPTDVGGARSDTELSMVSRPSIQVRGHVQGIGWQDWSPNSAGTSGQSRRMEALEAQLVGGSVSGGIECMAHVQGIGWQDWTNGTAGTTGESRRVEAFGIRLTGEISQYMDVWYRTHCQTFGWLGWAKNGELAGTSGASKRMEALEVVLAPKGAAAPGSTEKAYRENPRSRMVLIGDSRTLQMYYTFYGPGILFLDHSDPSGNHWIARNGAGYNWFQNNALEKVEPWIASDAAVVVMLGVNDSIGWYERDFKELADGDTDKYAELLNRKAQEWRSKGAMVYYCTINPVGMRPGDDDFYFSDLSWTNNPELESWNNQMRSKLSTDVEVLDSYSYIKQNYYAPDELHYDDATNVRMYDFLVSSVLDR